MAVPTIATLAIDPDIAKQIRAVTDGEVEHYREHGWVLLKSLISRQLAGRMLEAVQNAGCDVQAKGGSHVWMHPALLGRAEPFVSVTFAPVMGRNAQRLIDRERLTDRPIGVQYRQDIVLGKPPAGADDGTHATPYHQDSASGGPDRTGGLNFWIALNEVTPEQGAMRFLSGSHREGPLGVSTIRGETHGRLDMVAEYPRLTSLYPPSPPFHYEPGDATVHGVNMVHGTPPNTTDRTRWSFIISYLPDDVRYDGRPDDLIRESDLSGLEQGMPFRHAGAPLVYPEITFFDAAGSRS